MPALSSFLMAAQGISAVSSIVGGLQGQSEGDNQAALAISQASQRGTESVRAAEREAKFTQDEALATERKQKLAYLSSGVTLEGSPLLVMEETRQKGQDNFNEIIRAGQAEKTAAELEGRVLASQAKSKGREAFTSGLMGGLSAGANAYQSWKDK